MLVNTSAMVVPQPPGQSELPITPPVLTVDVQVKVVPAMVEFNGKLLLAPLQITMLLAEPTGNGLTTVVTLDVAVHPLAVLVTVTA